MSKIQEQINIAEINEFLLNNGIDPKAPMNYEKKFETFYYVGDKRHFAEPTRIGFDITGTAEVNVSMHEINHIEFETAFKVTEQIFKYDDDKETLSISGDSAKHTEPYRVVINSIYLEF